MCSKSVRTRGTRLRTVRVERADALADVSPDVEAQAFHRRVKPGPEIAGSHAALHPFADAPVLAIDEIPKFHRVGGIELRLGHLRGMEQEVTHDFCVLRRA